MGSSTTEKPIGKFQFLFWCLKGSRLLASQDKPYIARCNFCSPKQIKEFANESDSKEWGRVHELDTRILIGRQDHIVHYGMKAGT